MTVGAMIRGLALGGLACVIGLAAAGGGAARADQARLTIDDAARAAASRATNLRTHVMPLRPASPGAQFLAPARPAATPTGPSWYPADVSVGTGKVTAVTKASFNNIYVNCTNVTSCWGDPKGFLTNLAKSTMIHVADQYLPSKATGQFTFGTTSNATVALYTSVSGANPMMSESDILALVYAAAKTNGGGYGQIYNVFLPKGVDTCFDETSSCYSPDNPASWAFCAYHSSVDFGTLHVLYTVQPYQKVDGCQVSTAPGTLDPNLTDSTASVLSHETFETITDPDPGLGWTNTTSLDLNGYEIGDECQNTSFVYAPITLNGTKYRIQLEYSNTYHACVSVP